jgi:4-oxalocrotonate tautomerase
LPGKRLRNWGEKGKRVKRRGKRGKGEKGKARVISVLIGRPGGYMPFVNIKITRDGATAAQKAELIKGVTDLLVKVLYKNPATTVVVIDEVDTDNWGIGGETVTSRRRENR